MSAFSLIQWNLMMLVLWCSNCKKRGKNREMFEMFEKSNYSLQHYQHAEGRIKLVQMRGMPKTFISHTVTYLSSIRLSVIQ